MDCRKAIVVTLALAGLALGQTAPSGPANTAKQKMSTLRELPGTT